MLLGEGGGGGKLEKQKEEKTKQVTASWLDPKSME